MPGRIYEFVQLDVFTPTPLTDNQLAVFSDARGLSDDEMLALAREMATREGERVTDVRVGGYAVEILRGTVVL